jgi:hypothetical protein
MYSWCKLLNEKGERHELLGKTYIYSKTLPQAMEVRNIASVMRRKQFNISFFHVGMLALFSQLFMLLLSF